MNVLTTTEFYINEDVQNKVNRDKENYQELLDNFFPNDVESIPLLAFAYYSLDDYPNLLDKLNFMTTKAEFSVHSYYYLLQQVEDYMKEGIQPGVCNELAQKDLLEIYQAYNQTPLIKN